MSTRSLPERPNFEQLRRQAKQLRHSVLAGDPQALDTAELAAAPGEFSLAQSQRALARSYGFASWARLKSHVEALVDRTWTHEPPAAEESVADTFLRRACLNYDRDAAADRVEAATLLERHPELAATSAATAAVTGDVQALAATLAGDRQAANAPAGPYGWTPLMYVAYSRHLLKPEVALEVATRLLDTGADPNDGRFFAGRPTPFTILTGVFGGGEADQPAHPQSVALARLLLVRGASPNDGQTLYNRQFRDEDDFLVVLLAAGLGRGDGGPWRRLLPDLLPAPAELAREPLEWAALHDQRARIRLLAEHGVDVVSPLDNGPTPVELALANGHGELVELLIGYGATRPTLSKTKAFIAAVLAEDRMGVEATPSAIVTRAKQNRPALIVWAAGQERLVAVELLAAVGFDVNALGRSDVPREEPWQTGLHAAVERGNADLIRLLLGLGADPNLRDARFDGTPADWAEHFNRPDLAQLLATSDQPGVR